MNLHALRRAIRDELLRTKSISTTNFGTRRMTAGEASVVAWRISELLQRIDNPEVLSGFALRRYLELPSPQFEDDDAGVTAVVNAVDSLLTTVPESYVHVALQALALRYMPVDNPRDPFEPSCLAPVLADVLVNVERLCMYRVTTTHLDGEYASGMVDMGEDVLRLIEGAT